MNSAIQKPSVSESAILIFRQGSVGDTVVALPCFRLIKNAFPDAKISVLTNMPVNNKACALELILQNTSLVDFYLEYPSKSSLLKKCLSVRKIIKENNFTTMIYLNQTLHLRQAWRDFLFFKLCGIKKIIGLSLREGGYHYLYDAQKKIFESERCRLARQIKLLGEVDWRDPNIMNLNIIDTELQKARAFLPHDFLSNPFIVCSIGTKLEMKDWGQANWIALIAALTKQYSNYGMVFIGVSDEYERSAELLNSWNGKTLNLCGKLSVRESAAVLSFARLFFGHDSGPMHLAAAVGTQCVAIFSRHAKPGCWFPFGKQHIVLYPKPGETILNIRVDSVLNEVQRVLEA